MQHLFSRDIKDAYAKGQRIFESIELYYAELESIDLSGIVFKNCKLNFTSFRMSKMKNTKFINCEWFFGSGYGADFENAVFEKTIIDFIRFDTANFNRTLFKNCKIKFCTMINSNSSAAEFIDCIKYKVFSQTTEITDSDVQEGVGMLMPSINSLGIEIRSHILNVMTRFSSELNKPLLKEQLTSKNTYSTNAGANAYQKLSDLLGEAISSYESKHPYIKPSSAYDKNKGPYKK